MLYRSKSKHERVKYERSQEQHSQVLKALCEQEQESSYSWMLVCVLAGDKS